MEKIALITDSTSDLYDDELEKYDIKVARLKVRYKDREYTDGIDITSQEIYKRLSEEVPTTSTPTLGDIEKLFQQLIDEDYTHVIAIPISSGLSGTMNNFRLVADSFSDKLETAVFDSKSISRTVALLLFKISNLIKEGKSFKEITSVVPSLRDKTGFYFTVDSLDYLIKGGRIGRISGSIGQMLNIKPIITMDDNGKYISCDKARGSKQAFNKLVKLGLGLLGNNKYKFIVMHGNVPDRAKELYNAFKGHPNLTSIEIGTLSAVAGVHSGPTILAFCYIQE